MNICGILYVNLTYTDGLMRKHLGLMTEKVLQFSLRVMMIHDG